MIESAKDSGQYLLNFRWPYQASVMKTFDRDNITIGKT